jgi:hypothetical protein
MIERSFTKEKDLPQHKNFGFTKAVGREFGDFKNLSKLSDLGRNIISKFIEENTKKEETLKKKEHDLEVYKHSKKTIEYNPWKNSCHIIEEFSRPPGDKVVSYRKEHKRKFLIQEPFKRPKKDGEYFEKKVKLI